MDALPDDALAGVLGRLPARSLAAARRVCRSWRGLVDGRRLLLPHLLPHSVAGLFGNYYDHETPHFFARRPTPPPDHAGHRRRIDGRFSFVAVRREKPYAWHSVLDHCNGLVLFHDDDLYVCNPATRRWARLPPPPSSSRRRRRPASGDDDWHCHWHRALVAFDPAASPYFEVLLVPLEPHEKQKMDQHRHGDGRRMTSEEDGGALETTEWPPATWTWQVISSRTRRWEERVFVREGAAAGTVAGLLLNSEEPQWPSHAYCQGKLYLHCRGEYVTRLSMSTNKYRVIKLPIDQDKCHKSMESIIVGRSAGNSVRFAAVDRKDRLRIWILDESGDKMEWQLKHQSVVSYPGYEQRAFDDGPWIIDDLYKTKGEEELNEGGWSSDNDDVVTNDIVDNGDDSDDDNKGYVSLAGFHPFKEVIFLLVHGETVVAYHLNSRKAQYLGYMSPRTYNRGLHESFVYTPCMF